MIQKVDLPEKVRESLDLAVTLSMEHGDDIHIRLNDQEVMVLQIDGVSGIITGWIE